jgi:hypothetical protein
MSTDDDRDSIFSFEIYIFFLVVGSQYARVRTCLPWQYHIVSHHIVATHSLYPDGDAREKVGEKMERKERT